MNESAYPSVTITFDGMMLFHFDGPHKRCEVMFREVHDHKIEVIVKKKRGNAGSEELHVPGLTHEALRRYDYLWLYVENQGNTRDPKTSGAAGLGKWYDRILQLDGQEFYNSPLKLKGGEYKPTMYVCDGCVGADNGNGKDSRKDKDSDEKWGLSRVESIESNEATCYRVEDVERQAQHDKPKYSFKELKYGMSNHDWQRLKNSYKNDLIKPLNPFLRWVNTTIDLSSGQSLMLVGEDEDGATQPFSPLITNYQESDEYWIHIKYTDSDTPDSLEDCKGMGHHCEAFEHNGSSLDPLYSVFSPKSGLVHIPVAPWEPEIRSSDVPCCLSACFK